jgi:hypothetical protein
MRLPRLAELIVNLLFVRTGLPIYPVGRPLLAARNAVGNEFENALAPAPTINFFPPIHWGHLPARRLVVQPNPRSVNVASEVLDRALIIGMYATKWHPTVSGVDRQRGMVSRGRSASPPGMSPPLAERNGPDTCAGKQQGESNKGHNAPRAWRLRKTSIVVHRVREAHARNSTCVRATPALNSSRKLLSRSWRHTVNFDGITLSRLRIPA